MLPIYIRTLSQLKIEQIGYFALRRVLRLPLRHRMNVSAAPRRAGVMLRTAPLSRAMDCDGERVLRFVGVPKAYVANNVDWASREMSRLWRYQLHYFDYALEAGRSPDDISALVDDWIARNPVGAGDGWEPYPVSLRIVNWVKLFLSGRLPRIKADWLDSLYRQARWLRRNLERHLLANHYLKNAKALLFAGSFFGGVEADRWLALAQRVLLRQVDEQFLADGGHFERSPMYHALAIEDCIDVLNLAGGSRGVLGDHAVSRLTSIVERGLAFLDDITLPDGDIPLFNDSAFDVASTPAALHDYARRVIGLRAAARKSNAFCSAKPASGYFVMRDGDDMLVVDCGEIGPTYQPGHAHCDTLSFELAIGGRRVIVDSGVFEYAPGEMRRYVRSTGAHNTATIDGGEQSELWAAFRAGRRAHVIDAALARTSASSFEFSGAHDGYAHLSGRPIHRRRIRGGDGAWWISDRFEGAGEHAVDIFLHLHPDWRPLPDGDVISICSRTGIPIGHIEAPLACSVAVEAGWYCPRFGSRQANRVVRFTARGRFPLQFDYRIVAARRQAARAGNDATTSA